MTTMIRIVCGAAALVLFSAAGYAQDEFNIALPAPVGAGAPIMFQHKEGAGVFGQTFEFISSEMGLPGKIVKGAPYSAEAVTETTQTLADGNRIAHKNSTVLYRDSEGRTRREVTLGAIGPWASSADGGAKMVLIHDPVAGVSYTLNENDKTARKTSGNAMVVSLSSHSGERHVVSEKISVARAEASSDTLKPMVGTKALAYGPMTAMRMPAADAKNAKTESLGKRNIEGVEAEGTLTTHTIAAGVIGNERPIEITFERWYSPELQTVVMTRQADPRAGETVYKLSNLRRGEPAQQLFEVPSEYKVVTEEIPKMMRKLRNEK